MPDFYREYFCEACFSICEHNLRKHSMPRFCVYTLKLVSNPAFTGNAAQICAMPSVIFKAAMHGDCLKSSTFCAVITELQSPQQKKRADILCMSTL
jgi:hypothetical protein